MEYSDMGLDLETGLGLDKSKPGASWSTQRWIESILRCIEVDRVKAGSAKWIRPKYNFLKKCLVLSFWGLNLFLLKSLNFNMDLSILSYW